MNIGRAVRLVRTAKGVTQKELAERAGCTANYLSMVERGDRRPSIKLVGGIASSLDVPVAEIFALGADPPTSPDPSTREVVTKLRELMLLLNRLES